MTKLHRCNTFYLSRGTYPAEEVICTVAIKNEYNMRPRKPPSTYIASRTCRSCRQDIIYAILNDQGYDLDQPVKCKEKPMLDCKAEPLKSVLQLRNTFTQKTHLI